MKKAILFILCLCILTGLICSRFFIKQGQNDIQEAGAEEAVTLESYSGPTMAIQYSENYYPFSGGYFIYDTARIDNTLLFLGFNETETILGLARYSVSSTGRVNISKTQAITPNNASSADEMVYCIAAGEDGCFYAVSGAKTDNTGTFYITRLSQDGESSDVMEIDDWPDDTVRDIHVTSSGIVTLIGDRYLVAFEWKGKLVGSDCLNGDFITCSFLTDDKVIISTMYSGYYQMDTHNGRFTPSDVLYADDETGTTYIAFGSCQSIAGELVINDGTYFQQYNCANNTWDKLLSWRYSNISLGGFGSACRLSNSSFLLPFTDKEAVLVTGMEEVPYQEKSIVNVALVGVSERVLEEINNKNRLYEYHAVKYSKDEITRFLTDMVTGNTPDLVIFKDTVNTSSSYFEDLLPFIDSDSELSRDSFLPNLLDALATDGELYQLWDQVLIYTIAARASDVGDGQGMTSADYNRMVAESDQYQTVFDMNITKQSLLNWIAQMSVGTFVDKAHATVDFDNQAFRELLAWCKDMGDGIKEGSDSIVYDRSEILLLFEIVQGMGRIDYLPELFGEPPVFVGFPNGSDGFSYYSISGDSYGRAMAIPKNSQNKEGAWEFIKYMLSLDRQLNLGEYANLPVNYEALKRIADSTISDDAKVLLFSLLGRTKYAQAYADEGLVEIIISSGQSYLNGDKSLEETIKLIQSRASIYVSEQYGG